MQFMEKVKKMSVIDILLVIVALYAAYMVYKCGSTMKTEHMFVDSQPAPVDATYTAERTANTGSSSSCGSGNFVSSDMLPKKEPNGSAPASGFEFAPTQDLQGINFLTAEQKIGIDSIHSSLRNANHSIRDDPYIPKTAVSPWMNSTIEPDPMRNSVFQ
jgi:hypothetical protein